MPSDVDVDVDGNANNDTEMTMQRFPNGLSLTNFEVDTSVSL